MSRKSFLNQEIFNNFQKAVKFQTESTSQIYDCRDEHALAVFSKELTSNMLKQYHSQLEEHEEYNVATTSAVDYPTGNISKALIKSNIKRDGLLPKGKCYLTRVIEGEGNYLDEERYNNQKKDIENKISNVSNWVKANEETDPNMYELMDIFISAGKFEGDLSEETIAQLKYLKEKRMDDLENRVGINKDDDLYKISNEVCNSTLEGIPTTYSGEVSEYICKLASINTYIAQMKRDNKDFHYDNKYEFEILTALKERAEKVQTILPSSCSRLFNNLSKELKVEKGFMDELKSMTVDNPREVRTSKQESSIETEER